MKKIVCLLALCFILAFAVAAVSAQEAETPADDVVVEEIVPEVSAADPVCEKPGFKVTYLGNNCLAEVPADDKSYAAGETVTVLFEPVKYMDYKVFYGWDMNDDGIADFGYSYKTFAMPDKDIELKAICVAPSWVGSSACSGCHISWPHGHHGHHGYSGLHTFTIVPFGL